MWRVESVDRDHKCWPPLETAVLSGFGSSWDHWIYNVRNNLGLCLQLTLCVLRHRLYKGYSICTVNKYANFVILYTWSSVKYPAACPTWCVDNNLFPNIENAEYSILKIVQSFVSIMYDTLNSLLENVRKKKNNLLSFSYLIYLTFKCVCLLL